MARAAARWCVARERHRREVADEWLQISMARPDWGRLLRPGGGERTRVCDGPETCDGREESVECFFSWRNSRRRTCAVPERSGRENPLAVRIRLLLHRKLRGGAARHADDCRWKSLH